jgi:hypothetical protein
MSPVVSDADAALPRQERAMIVLLALLQGLLLYLAEQGQTHGIWPLAELHGRVCWYSLVLVVPTMMMLSLQRVADRRFAWQALGSFGVVLALSLWAGWNATGAAGLAADEVLAPFGFTLAISAFVALPYLQVSILQRRWSGAYPLLFERAWHNTLSLALTGVFVGLGWLMLVLWGELFALVKIHFFRDLFREKPFIYLATGLLFGLGMLIGRTQSSAIRTARSIVLALLYGLLPVLAMIAVMFLASLPFTGLEPLWKTGHAGLILGWVIVLHVGLVNAVLQDGREQLPYPLPLRWLIQLSIALLPMYAALAVYGLGLRVEQYGWTPARVWAAIALAVLSLYALGYSASFLRAPARWMPHLPRINIAVSLVVVALGLLANSPVLDPHRIAVASQLNRFERSTDNTQLDLDYLRFEGGRQGVVALRGLLAHPRIQADDEKRQEIEELLARQVRWGVGELDASELAGTPETLRTRLKLATGAIAPDADYLRWVIARPEYSQARACRSNGNACVLLSLDVDSDGDKEYLLCNLHDRKSVQCELASRESTGWRYAGPVSFYNYDNKAEPDLRSALRAGQVDVVQPRWGRLHIAGLTPQPVEDQQGEIPTDCQQSCAESAERNAVADPTSDDPAVTSPSDSN